MKANPLTHPTASRQRPVILLVLATLISTLATLPAKPPWAPAAPDVIMTPGITAATCSAQKRDANNLPIPASSAYVFGMFDLRNPSSPDYTTLNTSATMWNAPEWHHPTWTAREMGCVFGIATDPQGNTYTAANGLWAPVYSPSSFGDPYLRYGDLGRAGSDEIGASGTIYIIDALTGAASVFARVPQVSDPDLPIVPVGTTKGGPGIGNITVDPASGNLFATSLDDGKIYQFDSSGAALGTFDPFTVETTPAPGMVPLGERLFAIEAHDGTLYFSVWNGGTVGNENEIWSVALPGGVIDPPSLTQEFVVPASYGASSSNSVTVSDLSFSADGTTLLIGERAFQKKAYIPPFLPGSTVLPDFYSPHNHTTAARRAEFVSGSWTLTGEVATGNNVPAGEAYGGVEFGFEAGSPEEVVWMSSADIATGAGPHGLQGMRMTDFPAPAAPPTKVSDSYVVPYVPGTGPSGPDFKGMGGDLETIKPEDDCVRITIKEITCPKNPGDPFALTLNLENLQSQPISSYGAVPTPVSSLPGGALPIQPQPVGWIPLPTTLNQGDSANITLELPGLSGGEMVCFNLTFLDEKFEACCTETVCVDVPKCECALVHDIEVTCRRLADGTWAYDLSLTIENTSHLTGSPISAYGMSFGPDITAFSPNYLDLSGSPFNPLDVRTFQTTYTGPSGTLCFKIALHSEGNVECCFLEEMCIELPPCGDVEPVPDCCILTPSRTFCCPLTGEGVEGLNGARVRYTICNKSDVAQSYHWTIENLGPGRVSFVQYDPAAGLAVISGGTLGPVAPGECLTTEIIILCEMEPGECADYVIRASAGSGSPALICRGRICQPEPDTPIIKGTGDDIMDLAPGEVRPFTYLVKNPGDREARIPVTITSSYGAVGISAGRETPGTSALETNVVIPAKGEIRLPVYLSRLDGDGVLPTAVIQLFANVGERTVNGADDHVSSLMLTSRDWIPFRVLDLDPPGLDGQRFVQLNLFLARGPMEMAVQEYHRTTGKWENIPVQADTKEGVNRGTILLAAGRQAIYLPRTNQNRGIFRVICLDDPVN